MTTIQEPQTESDLYEMEDVLPNTPSELIRVALKDLRAAEAAETVEIDMGVWHDPVYERDVCVMCFAGSVMRGTFKAEDTWTVDPDYFAKDVMQKMFSLDSLQRGSFVGFIDDLRQFLWLQCGEDERRFDAMMANAERVTRKFQDKPFYYYRQYDDFHRDKWFAIMEDFASSLEAVGL